MVSGSLEPVGFGSEFGLRRASDIGSFREGEMEYPLSGVNQFIVTSVTFLITSNLAAYVTRVDEKIRDRIREKKPRHDGLIMTYRVILAGWWIITLSAICGAIRMLASPFYESFVFDMFILVLMTAGYGVIAWSALRSWKWSSWGGWCFG